MEVYTSLEQLPVMLGADDVAKVLGISLANAYVLMHKRGFPTLKIGKRMVVPKERLLAWIDCQIPA
jgi:predicted DNA-binding transcriptional regulator AlpA